jgi:hypothetical protein
MTDSVPSKLDNADNSESSDLAERLAKYRRRVEREGRTSALERLDREIDKARRVRKPD